MIQSSVVYSNQADATAAAKDLAAQIKGAFKGERPDALILFAAPTYDQPALLKALKSEATPQLLVGASSAGEFTSATRGEGLACALALRSSDLVFNAGLGTHLASDRTQAARSMLAGFRGGQQQDFPHRAAMIMTDALAGHADDLVDQLTLLTSGKYDFFGGGAGDNAQFSRTAVFFDTEVVTDAAVALEILSKKPLGVGVGHGWEPGSTPLRVTAADGMRVISLNGLPAVQAFEEYAENTQQKLDTAAPIPFFLHNILGIETAAGHRLRVPLAVNADGSVTCAAEIPAGAVVRIMRTTSDSAVDAAKRATRAAVTALEGQKPQVALFFDCVATRLRMGDAFSFELNAVSDQLGGAPYLGCNTHGQIARAPGQFSGFHNCTAVVCVFPE